LGIRNTPGKIENVCDISPTSACPCMDTLYPTNPDTTPTQPDS
jgi:hypothetical protein